MFVRKPKPYPVGKDADVKALFRAYRIHDRTYISFPIPRRRAKVQFQHPPDMSFLARELFLPRSSGKREK